MNERINQLLSQAYDEAVPETWTTLSSEQLGRIYDKFAELIVRECVREFVRKLPVSVNVSNRAAHVFKHFGVKE